MSVTAPRGFVAAGVSAGIRPSGKPDVALVRSLVPSVGCAMWTTNRVQAAPVTVSRRHLVVQRSLQVTSPLCSLGRNRMKIDSSVQQIPPPWPGQIIEAQR